LEKYAKLNKKYFSFLKEVFEGVMLNYQLLSIFVLRFLEKIKSGKKELERLMIMGYLVLFRFEDIKAREFNTIVLVQPPLLMHQFLGFLFSKSEMMELAFPMMEKVFDKAYLSRNLNLLIGR
jgi:hypothetical protein